MVYTGVRKTGPPVVSWTYNGDVGKGVCYVGTRCRRVDTVGTIFTSNKNMRYTTNM